MDLRSDSFGFLVVSPEWHPKRYALLGAPANPEPRVDDVVFVAGDGTTDAVTVRLSVFRELVRQPDARGQSQAFAAIATP